MKRKRRYRINWTRLILVNAALILLIVFTVGKVWESKSKSKGVARQVLSTKVLNKKGNINLEENKFYRKFIISAENAQDKVNYKINGSYVELTLDKESKKPYFSYSKKSEADYVKCEKSYDKYIVKIKTLFKENNYVFIDPADNKNIIILISKSKKPYDHVVNIDPGHGGIDKGTNYKDLYEKDITLKIAKLTKNNLIYSGYKVNLSRNDDTIHALRNIADWSNNSDAEILISIHINSNKDSRCKGITTYYSETRSDTASSSQNPERIKLSKALQQEASVNNWKDMGVVNQKLKLLRYSKLPCALIECGFLTNDEDKSKLQNNEVLSELAINITKGVDDYFKNNIFYKSKSNNGALANEAGGN